MVLVEAMRQSQNLDKAMLFSSSNSTAPFSFAKYEVRQERVVVPKAKQLFRKWWETYSNWEQKTEHNPLDGSDLVISAP